MPSLSDLFGRGAESVKQLFIWQVLGQLLGALMEPATRELSYLVNQADTNAELTPAELATAVNRGFLPKSDAHTGGNKYGLSDGKMDTLIDMAGEAPSPETLVEALRRGLIAEDSPTGGVPSFNDGIREGNLRDVWAPLMKELAVQLPTWSDALDALLEGQLDEATARAWYLKAGGDPAAFEWLFDTRGSAPTPVQAADMANRGIIPWDGTGPDSTSFHQAFLEGPWRNKWLEPFRKLAEYRPPPRTITALLRSGSITEQQAMTWFKQSGMTPEVAAAYVKDATTHKTGAARELTRTDVENLYAAHVIDAAAAQSMLTKLGYPADEARLLLSGIDLRRTISNTQNAVTRIRSLFIAHRIDTTEATDALTKLGMSAPQIRAMIETWTIAEAANVKALTPSQIARSWKLGILTQDQAQAELVASGYTAFDSWVVLSLENKAPLPGRPAGP